jgi:hypothetical protein
MTNQKRFPREDDLAPEPTGGVDTVAFAWLPAGDYEQALKMWPDFAGSDRVAGPDGPLPHSQYCRAMQQQLAQYAEAVMPRMAIAPVRRTEAPARFGRCPGRVRRPPRCPGRPKCDGLATQPQ